MYVDVDFVVDFGAADGDDFDSDSVVDYVAAAAPAPDASAAESSPTADASVAASVATAEPNTAQKLEPELTSADAFVASAEFVEGCKIRFGLDLCPTLERCRHYYYYRSRDFCRAE